MSVVAKMKSYHISGYATPTLTDKSKCLNKNTGSSLGQPGHRNLQHCMCAQFFQNWMKVTVMCTLNWF